MNTVWKYTLPVSGRIELNIPAGAKLLCVQMQFDRLCMWALVDPTAPISTRCFWIVGTGHELLSAPGAYVGTFQINGGALVFHVFEEPM